MRNPRSPLPPFHKQHLELPFNHSTSYWRDSFDSTTLEKQDAFEKLQDVDVRSPLLPSPLSPRDIALAKFEKKMRRVRLGLEIILEVLMAATLVPFIILAIMASTLNGKPESAYGDNVMKANLFGPTLYPIVFAAVVGRALYNIASWKLERGARVGTLESLARSKTITSTLCTQIVLGRFSLLSVGLCLLWSISPLAGQATLRVVQKVERAEPRHINVTHVNTEVSATSFAVPPFLAPIESDARFTSALMANRTSSSDQFRNVRLSRTVGGNDWISALGMPVADVPTQGTTMFNMTASSLAVDIIDVARVPNINNYSNYNFPVCDLEGGLSGFQSHFGFQFLNDPQQEKEVLLSMVIGYKPSNDSSSQFLPVESASLEPLLLNYTMKISMETADYHIRCNDDKCAMSSRTVTPRSKELTWLSSMSNNQSWLLTSLSCVGTAKELSRYLITDTYLMLGKPFLNNHPPAGVIAGPNSLSVNESDVSSSTEKWVADDEDIFMGYDRSNQTALMQMIPDSVIGFRLSQLLNTYYMATYREGYGYGHGFPPNRDAWIYKTTVPAVTSTIRIVYSVNQIWAAVVGVLSIIPICLSLIGSYLRFRTSQVDVLGFVSSLTRTNHYLSPEHNGGFVINNELGGLQRTRVAHDMIISFGDVGGGKADQDLQLFVKTEKPWDETKGIYGSQRRLVGFFKSESVHSLLNFKSNSSSRRSSKSWVGTEEIEKENDKGKRTYLDIAISNVAVFPLDAIA